MANDPPKKQSKKASNSAFQKFEKLAGKIVRAPKGQVEDKPPPR